MLNLHGHIYFTTVSNLACFYIWFLLYYHEHTLLSSLNALRPMTINFLCFGGILEPCKICFNLKTEIPVWAFYHRIFKENRKWKTTFFNIDKHHETQFPPNFMPHFEVFVAHAHFLGIINATLYINLTWNITRYVYVNKIVIVQAAAWPKLTIRLNLTQSTNSDWENSIEAVKKWLWIFMWYWNFRI